MIEHLFTSTSLPHFVYSLSSFSTSFLHMCQIFLLSHDIPGIGYSATFISETVLAPDEDFKELLTALSIHDVWVSNPES